LIGKRPRLRTIFKKKVRKVGRSRDKKGKKGRLKRLQFGLRSLSRIPIFPESVRLHRNFAKCKNASLMPRGKNAVGSEKSWEDLFRLSEIWDNNERDTDLQNHQFEAPSFLLTVRTSRVRTEKQRRKIGKKMGDESNK